jgi:acyl-CoA dehydrogenase
VSYVEELSRRTARFVREVVIPAEPAPGLRLAPEERARLQAAAKENGVFAPHVGTEFGGQGLTISDWSPTFQAAGYSHIGPVALNCMAPDEGNMHMLEVIATAEQKERYLRPLAAGDVRSCFAMTEPHQPNGGGAGSDPDALSTIATPVAGGWRIDGEKRFISGAVGAGFAIVMARTDAATDARDAAAATMFLVDSDNPGMRIGGQIHAIDRAIDGGHPYLHFENCVVPESAVLGAVGEGFRYAQVRLGPARLTHCMRWLGLARRAHDIALDRVERREIFGSAMKNLGLAQELIARNVIDIETSDAIITKTASLLETDPRAGSALSSVAKVHCSDAVFAVIDRAMQLCGGDGMSDALPLASYFNEVRPFRVYDGSNETHKWAIARRAVSGRAKQVASGAEKRLDEVVERD